MSHEVSTKAQIIPKADSSFGKLTVEQRDQVLTEVAASLHYSALVSRAVADGSAKDMERLADKIDNEHEAIAADYSPASGEVVHTALDLMNGFHRRMNS